MKLKSSHFIQIFLKKMRQKFGVVRGLRQLNQVPIGLCTISYAGSYAGSYELDELPSNFISKLVYWKI